MKRILDACCAMETVDRTCENCWYYKVCENGCWGSIEPCEHFTNYDMEVNQNDE